jgi:Fe(3+) dicitrate transport protein
MVSNLTIGYKQDKFKSSLVVSYVSAQFTDQGNNVSITELTNNDLWSGKLQGYTVADINLSYTVDKNLSYFGSIRNLTDTHYIASLRQGIYVGTSRNVMAGIRYKF